MGDARFLPDLFSRLKASGPADEGWEDQVAFLQELCGLAKHLQPGNRAQLLGRLAHLGLFEARHRALILPPGSRSSTRSCVAAGGRDACVVLCGPHACGVSCGSF